jgi:hypothetical protein
LYAEGYWTESGSDLLKLSRFARDANGVPQESFEALDQLNIPRPSLLPDPELFCIDDLFWYSEQPQWWDFHTEWRLGTGAWAIAGKYLRFQPALVGLADRYLRNAIGLQPHQTLPPFFAVHIRRGGESRKSQQYPHPGCNDHLRADGDSPRSRLSPRVAHDDNSRTLRSWGMGGPT